MEIRTNSGAANCMRVLNYYGAPPSPVYFALLLGFFEAAAGGQQNISQIAAKYQPNISQISADG
jgi:hypothetical protein